MKYCTKCGYEMKNEEIFCKQCGTRFEQPDNQNSGAGQENQNNTVNAFEAGNQSNVAGQGFAGQNMQGNVMQNGNMNAIPGTKKKIDKRIIIAVIAAAAVLVIGFFTYRTLSRRINVNDYVKVNYKGYNTAGTASIDIDEEGLLKAILKKKGITYTSESDLKGTDRTKALQIAKELYDSDNFECKLDKTTDLSNGDKITETVTISKNLNKTLGVTLYGKNKSYTVSDLKEATTINPFDYLDVTFSGTAPKATISLKKKDDTDSFIKSLNFKANKSSGINIGDKITVTVTTNSETALQKGYILSETSKEYVCEKADQYVSKISDIPAEKYKDLQKDATDKVESYFAGIKSDYGVTYKELKFEGSYLLTSKSGSSHNMYVVCSAKVSATASGSNKGFEETKVYFPVSIPNVMLKSNGKITHDSYLSIKGNNTKLNYGWSSISGYTDGAEMFKEIVTASKDQYTYEVDGTITEFGK